jgi:hypothetical protein
MRWSVRFVFVLALVGFPQGVGAQAEKEGATSEPNLQEPAPPSEAVPEEPALQLQLDDAGVQLASPPPRTPDGYTLEKVESRVKRAKVGLISSSVIVAGGVAAMGGAAALARNADDFGDIGAVGGLGIFAGALMVGGIIGISISGKRLSTAKREQHELEQAHRGPPRRVQWDLARSRLVF